MSHSAAKQDINLAVDNSESDELSDEVGFGCRIEFFGLDGGVHVDKKDRFSENVWKVESERGDQDGGDEDLFQGDLVMPYLREISRYPLLSPEREVELAKTIKEGQEELTSLMWDERVADGEFDGVRQQLRTWQDESTRFPGLRTKMAHHVLDSLKELAARASATEGHRCLHAEAREVAARIDAARNEMVEGNLRLVLSIAKCYRGRGVSFADLIQLGNMGLLNAVARYDYAKGYRFSTYASWWVRQSIIRGTQDQARTIRLPVHFIELKRHYLKIFRHLADELGREPTPEEIANANGLSRDKVKSIVRLSGWTVSLEAGVGNDERPMADFVADDAAVSPLEHASKAQLVEVMRQLLSSLSTREERILRSRFGIDGEVTQTLKGLGERLNVSKERVRQIEKRAICRLRQSSRSAELKCFLE